MKRVLPILLLTLQLGGCISSQECSCPEDCYKITQTPIPASVLYEAYSGSVIACSLPMHDRLIAAYNAQRTLKDSQLNLPYYWESPLWPLKGTFELLSFHQERHTTCFTYKQMINIDGAILTAQGLACKDPYQVWRIVNETPDTNPWLDSDPHGGFKASPELKTRLSRFID